MSSILETFLILFDSNADELDAGAKKAKSTTDKLNKSLSASEHTANKLAGSFKNLITQAGGAFLALVSAGALIQGARSAKDYANRLDELSKGLNVSVENLSLWGDAVKKNGGSAEEFQATAQSLTASLTAAATKGTSLVTPYFEKLGIKMKDARGRARTFLDILPELATKFEKLSKAESFGIGQKLGLDQGTIFLLQQGRREVESIIAQQKQLGVVTKEDAEIAAKFNNEWDNTTHIFRTLFTTINSNILPALTNLLKYIQKAGIYFKNNSDLIIGGLIGIGSAIAYFVTPALIRMLIAFAPFLLIAATIAAIGTAFALLYEDVVKFYQGHNSLLGELIKKYPKLGEILKLIEHDVAKLKEAFIALGNALPDLFKDLLHDLGIVFSLLGKIFKFIGKIGDAFKGVKSFFSDIPSHFETKVLTAGDFLGNNPAIMDNLQKAKSALSIAATSPIASQTSNSVTTRSNVANKNTNVQIDTIEVSTQATNSAEIAAAIDANLKVQLQQVASNFDDGVFA